MVPSALGLCHVVSHIKRDPRPKSERGGFQRAQEGVSGNEVVAGGKGMQKSLTVYSTSQ